jgi:hypothetical protein
MGRGQPRARAEEQRLREGIEGAHRGDPPAPLSDDGFCVLAYHPPPLRGPAAFAAGAAALGETRRHSARRFALERLVVAEAGDLAYESGTRSQEWDTPDGQREAGRPPARWPPCAGCRTAWTRPGSRS